MSIKVTTSYHYTPVGMVTIQKTGDNVDSRGCKEEGAVAST